MDGATKDLGLPPLPRRVAAPTRNLVIEAIRSRILDGTFKPAERIFEKKICDQLQASRTTIREALRHLESEGLIFVVPGKGPIVRTFTRTEVEDLFRAREVLEALAVTLFTERADTAAIDELRYASAELQARYDEGDVRRVLEAKDAFYEVLFSGSQSDVLRSLLRLIEGQTARFRRLSLSQYGRMSESAKEMEAICVAILSGDKEGATRATANHVKSACRAAFRALETQQIDDDGA